MPFSPILPEHLVYHFIPKEFTGEFFATERIVESLQNTQRQSRNRLLDPLDLEIAHVGDRILVVHVYQLDADDRGLVDSGFVIGRTVGQSRRDLPSVLAFRDGSETCWSVLLSPIV